jgi:putative oxidoreductase
MSASIGPEPVYRLTHGTGENLPAVQLAPGHRSSDGPAVPGDGIVDRGMVQRVRRFADMLGELAMKNELWNDIGLLNLRIFVGGFMLVAHGWGKLAGFGELAGKFPDPIGVGSTLSLALAVFAEVLCALLIMIGLGTRFAAVPLLITMLVAAFIVHADDPWGKKEFALLYAIPFLTLIFTGGGRFAVERLIKWKK